MCAKEKQKVVKREHVCALDFTVESGPAVRMNSTKRRHVSWLLLILALCGCVEVLQDALQVLKGGTLLRLVFPAFQHDIIEFHGAAVQALHPIVLLQGTDHFRVGHP